MNIHLKKTILCVRSATILLLCLLATSAAAQITPGGVLDVAIDRMGNQYNLQSMAVNDTVRADTGTIVANVVSSCSSGYFQIYMEPGCGMENSSDPTNVARLTVLCQMLNDLSSFIQSPLTTTGNKVNVWVRNPSNVTGFPGMGYATSLYNVPKPDEPEP